MAKKTDGSNITPNENDKLVKTNIDGIDVEVGITEQGATYVNNELPEEITTDEGKLNDFLSKVGSDNRIVELSNTLVKVKKERLDQNKLADTLKKKEQELKEKELKLKELERTKPITTEIDEDLQDKLLAKALNVDVDDLWETIQDLESGSLNDIRKLRKAERAVNQKVIGIIADNKAKEKMEQVKLNMYKQNLGSEYAEILAIQNAYGISDFEKAKDLYAQLKGKKSGGLDNVINKMNNLASQAPVYIPSTRGKTKIHTEEQEKIAKAKSRILRL